MGQRSKVTTLPPEVREWLDQSLRENNFAGYRQIAAELQGRGYSISKTAVHSYGQNLEKKLAAIRASTEAARAIAAAAPDDADQRSGAVISMLQTQLFDVLVNAQQLNDEKDPGRRMKLLSSLAANVSKLSNASGRQKKHELEIRAKAAAAADTAASIAKKGGLSQDGVEQIRRQILGIAQ